MDGSYQSTLNDVWNNTFPGRKALMKVRNQILYSTLHVSPNANVVIGKQGYLYEPGYIYYYEKVYSPAPDDYFLNLKEKLEGINRLLSSYDKELYVFITPSKADFYPEFFPERYDLLNCRQDILEDNYTDFIAMLNATGIKYFDAICYIKNNEDLGFRAPVFYKSGIHWSNVWGNKASEAFLDYMNECSRFDMGKIYVSESKSDIPVYAASDLYDSLNLICTPKEEWYTTTVKLINEGEDHPNVFYRGGSFMGQSINEIIKMGIFDKSVHFENSYYFIDGYEKYVPISAFDAYEEIDDLDQLLGQSDILVLEVNEGAIPNMSWGFIEYILEHPEFLDREY